MKADTITVQELPQKNQQDTRRCRRVILAILFFCVSTVLSPAQQMTTGSNESQIRTKGQKIDYGNLSLEQIKLLAEKGDAEAQFKLGECYETSMTNHNVAEATKWYQKAANQGNTDAEEEMGAAYYDGLGVTEDKAEGAKWYLKAANQGDGLAQWMIGNYYQDGDGLPQDPVEAVKWYDRAAEQGFYDAQLALATCYWGREGVSKDLVHAYKWASLAAARQYRLDLPPLEI